MAPRPRCQRCNAQPRDRVECLGCRRQVGPGCRAGCLVIELVEPEGRGRMGLCVDCHPLWFPLEPEPEPSPADPDAPGHDAPGHDG